MFAIHHPRPADPFPPLRLWRLTQPCQGNLRGETPLFQPFSTTSALCSLTHPAHPAPAKGAPPRNPFRINTCKSLSKQRTLTIFRMIYLQETWGWGVLWLTSYPMRIAVLSDHREPKDLSSTHPPVRPIAAGDPWCNNALRRKNSSLPRETTPLHSVSNRSERTSVTATARRRPGLQVVPGFIVLTVDLSRVARIGIQVIDAENRVGKAGSVRMG